jgi:hypothetical protein
MYNIDKKVFDENLLITQTYCEMQLANTDKSVAEILRSFNPEYNGVKIFSYAPSFLFKQITAVVWHENPLRDNLQLYTDLFKQQLSFKKEVLNIFDQRDVKGKILSIKLDDSFWDGCSEDCSDGFIDQFDCPPIDTWVYLIDNPENRVLYAWVPQQFVELIDVAIAVNALDCMSWMAIL